MILKIFLPKIWRLFLLKTLPASAEKVMRTMDFKKSANFAAENWQK
jgi:hypothetical protein